MSDPTPLLVVCKQCMGEGSIDGPEYDGWVPCPDCHPTWERLGNEAYDIVGVKEASRGDILAALGAEWWCAFRPARFVGACTYETRHRHKGFDCHWAVPVEADDELPEMLTDDVRTSR